MVIQAGASALRQACARTPKGRRHTTQRDILIRLHLIGFGDHARTGKYRESDQRHLPKLQFGQEPLALVILCRFQGAVPDGQAINGTRRDQLRGFTTLGDLR